MLHFLQQIKLQQIQNPPVILFCGKDNAYKYGKQALLAGASLVASSTYELIGKIIDTLQLVKWKILAS